MRISISELLLVNKVGIPIEQGTWVHPDVADTLVRGALKARCWPVTYQDSKVKRASCDRNLIRSTAQVRAVHKSPRLVMGKPTRR